VGYIILLFFGYPTKKKIKLEKETLIEVDYFQKIPISHPDF